MTDDPYNLQRFLDAQDRVLEAVLLELDQGFKRSHWMWFIFPQIAGLGRSATAAEPRGIAAEPNARTRGRGLQDRSASWFERR